MNKYKLIILKLVQKQIIINMLQYIRIQILKIYLKLKEFYKNQPILYKLQLLLMIILDMEIVQKLMLQKKIVINP